MGKPIGRDVPSLVLAWLAAAALLAGGVTLYARQEVVRASAFGDRAVDLLHRPAVQRVLARELAVQLLEPAVPDLIAGRPVIDSAITLIVSSKPFEPLIRLAAEHGRRLLFERGGGNAVFQLADAGTVVASALDKLAPKLAKDIPLRAQTVLLTLRRRSFAASALRFAETVRVLGLVLPGVAALLFVLALVLARDRRRATVRCGIATATAGVLLVIGYELCRRYLITHVYGTGELDNASVRAAAGAIWDAYLGDLLTWALAATIGSLLIAAVAAPLFAPYDAAAGLRRLRGWLLPTPLGAIRGTLVLVAGAFLIVEPSIAFRVLATLIGCLLLFVGMGAVLSATVPAEARRRPRLQLRSPSTVAAGATAAAAVIAVALAVILIGGSSRARARATLTCNGYVQLCSRRLDEVVFAGTHNSMSAADSPGWFIANQDRAVAQQLQDGIRLFKISTHYGIASSGGDVHTDIAASGPVLNRVAAKLDPKARAALQRLSLSLSNGSLSRAKRDVYLCHSLCELGATRMVDFLSTVRRFLQLNPGQVIILFDEDYVTPQDLGRVFRRAGLFDRLATLQPGRPLPTLGDLIRSGHNVLVFAQKLPSRRYGWDPFAFNWIQDTPLGATKPNQFTCRPYRGSATNPLLMMNDWADVFPPRPTPNLPLVKRSFIVRRARECDRVRGRIPNLILTDYYNRGDVIGAVRTLNGLGNQPAAKTEMS